MISPMLHKVTGAVVCVWSQFVSGGGKWKVLGMWGAGGGVVVSEFSGVWGKREEGGRELSFLTA